MIEKAANSPADAIIIDLEDSVAVEKKMEARENVVAALREVNFENKPVYLRINAINSPFANFDFLETIPYNLSGYVIPKVDDAETLERFHTWYESTQETEIQIFALIESAKGILNLREIVLGNVKLAGLMFGGEDYVASIGAFVSEGRQELLFARSAIVNAAAAIEVPAIDTVFTNFQDSAGLRADAETARQLGFDGKLLIHPDQIGIVHDVWRISSAEIQLARELLDEYKLRLRNGGESVFPFKGQMVDKAIIRRAKQVLQQASHTH
jgi:citrate lyase beta subunit